MKVIILAILGMIGTQCMCQSYLSFSPSIGLQRCFARHIGDNNSSIFKNNSFNQQVQLGFLLDYHYKDKWVVSTGYVYDHAGYAYSLKDNSSVKKDSNFISYSHSSAMRTLSIPLKVSFLLKEVNVVKSKSKHPTSMQRSITEINRDTHLLNFLFKLNAAIIYNHVPDRPFPKATYSNNQVSTTSEYSTINRNGVSISLGFSIHFLRRGKEFIGLNFYYSQGITSYESIKISYTTLSNNQSYQENLITKGTNCGISIFYPIKIITFNKSKLK
ncbi:hypothetical protein [uncultured Cytophaga sp.]|uniref:hypothetical protein n=1 Tax=uncultured Cytophaga sp. TaxID=160238 RepID=UPI002633F137|nr:hypothetical protein [uncultured Cytophaga sp.]